MDWILIVRITGTITCLLGIFIAWNLIGKKFSSNSGSKPVSIGIASISAVAFWKLTAFIGIVAIPLSTMGIANYHTMVGVHEVQACSRCHVMLPMVNDLQNPASDTLAARHFKNHWIPTGQCFSCHSNYGFSGDMAAKMEGFRHLARYTTRTYKEPISAKHTYDNRQCLKCHQEMPKFQAVKSHNTVLKRLETSDMSCLNCHGRVHPVKRDRTPGSVVYKDLMKEPNFSELLNE